MILAYAGNILTGAIVLLLIGIGFGLGWWSGRWNRKRDLRAARLSGMNQGIQHCRDNEHRHFLPNEDRARAVDAAIRKER